MDIAYTWAQHKSRCVVCAKEIRKRDGIGKAVDDAVVMLDSGTKAKWAHSRCMAAWEKGHQDAQTLQARQGYALRKGNKVTLGVTPGLSKVALKYDGRRPRKSKSVDGATLVDSTPSQSTISGITAFAPDSLYAKREGQIRLILEEICSFGVRIDRDALHDQLQKDNCSETVKSISRGLVGDRVFPSYSVSEITGRTSFKQPNLGSLAKDPAQGERSLVIAEQGHVLFTADMAQIEARVVAALCQDPDYMDQFAQGRDVHAEMAERLLGSASHREKAKRLVHGINYGMGKAKLAEAAQISISDAETVVRSMARQFPIWASWTEEMIQEGRRAGQLTNVFGRTVPVERSKAHTQSVSRLVQSTARDIFFQRIQIMSVVMPIGSMRLLLHDEVILSVPVDSYAEHAEMTQTCLSAPWRPSPRDKWIDLPVSISAPGTSWSQTRDLIAKVAA